MNDNVELYNSGTKIKIQQDDEPPAEVSIEKLTASKIAIVMKKKLDKLLHSVDVVRSRNQPQHAHLRPGADPLQRQNERQRVCAALQHLYDNGLWPALSLCLLSCKVDDICTMTYDRETMYEWLNHKGGDGKTGSMIPTALGMQLESRKHEATLQRILDHLPDSRKPRSFKGRNHSEDSVSTSTKALRSTSYVAKQLNSKGDRRIAR